MTQVIVQVVGAASAIETPHDGGYVVAWNPHTQFGMLELTSTPERRLAHRFDGPQEAISQWQAISKYYPMRPDGKPNRPLTGITIAIEAAP